MTSNNPKPVIEIFSRNVSLSALRMKNGRNVDPSMFARTFRGYLESELGGSTVAVADEIVTITLVKNGRRFAGHDSGIIKVHVRDFWEYVKQVFDAGKLPADHKIPAVSDDVCRALALCWSKPKKVTTNPSNWTSPWTGSRSSLAM